MVWAFTSTGCLFDEITYGEHYMALRPGVPRKAGKMMVPILEHRPQRPYTVIGKMAFETTQGIKFIHRSMQYNARKYGADAVIMHSLTSRRREWVESKPPSVRTEQTMDWVTKRDGSRDLEWVNKRIYNPGYINRHMEETLISVQAEMIVYQ